MALGSICKGRTNKELNDEFFAQFQEENLSNCKKFCNCQKDCKGFNFNPNSNNRKCSWKSDSPIETFTNAGIQQSGQSCVIKGNIAKKLVFTIRFKKNDKIQYFSQLPFHISHLLLDMN